VSEFIKVKVFAERTEFGPFGRCYSVTTNEIEEIIVPISRIVKITPKNEIKCLIDFDTSEGVDTRWCVMSSDEVMALITAKEGKQP
jgi:Mg2+/Co2+ transporter CorC